jgi:hypothetical protein
VGKAEGWINRRGGICKTEGKEEEGERKEEEEEEGEGDNDILLFITCFRDDIT